MTRWIAAAVTVASLGACTATRMARLYDLESAAILNASYRSNGSGKGPIFIGDPNNPECRGEFSTISGGETAWGALFAGGTAAQAIALTTDNDQRGSAIMTCTDGRVFECEYVASSLSGGGHGACRDNRDRRYRLMF